MEMFVDTHSPGLSAYTVIFPWGTKDKHKPPVLWISQGPTVEEKVLGDGTFSSSLSLQQHHFYLLDINKRSQAKGFSG